MSGLATVVAFDRSDVTVYLKFDRPDWTRDKLEDAIIAFSVNPGQLAVSH